MKTKQEVSLTYRFWINGNGELLMNPYTIKNEKLAATIGALVFNFLKKPENEFKFFEQHYVLEINTIFRNGELKSKLLRFVNNL